VLEVHLDLRGYPVTLLDTAGLREATDEVEAEGVRRARARAALADLRLLLLDGAVWPEVDAATLALLDADALSVVNKADLGRVPECPALGGRAALALSCRTGAGFERLLEALGAMAAERMAPGMTPLLTRSRHRSALQATLAALDRFGRAADGGELALLAEDLRLATRALGRITGRVGVDDILDRIFAEFCIGK
jgi:tRNA modification GTPase